MFYVIIREMQLKLKTTRYCLTPVRMAIIKKARDNIEKHMEKMESIYTGGRNINWHNHYGKP